VGNAVTAGLVLLYSHSFNWQGWSLASAAVVLAAWVMAGIPLAVSGMRFPSGRARALAIFIAGTASCAVVCLFFLPMALMPEGSFTLLLVVAGQAVSTSGISMLVYCLLAGGRFPAPASSNSTRN
jgi:hypothetical protein